ncbi:sensor histidine kinase [Lysobacter korlensis]|uniref:histidine kinase n=1 Tax=Lysobacter korlensis TaxID=553636 RepID=A0ABV6RYT8_9GAMM
MNTQNDTTYGSLWREVPRDLGFLLPLLPIVVVGQVVLATLLSAGAGLLAIFVGLFFLVGMMWFARWLGTFELARVNFTAGPRIEPPAWQTDGRTGFWAALVRPFTDVHSWRYLLHGLIVNFVVGIVSWVIAFTWTVTALGGVTYWIYSRWIPESGRDWNFLEILVNFFVPGSGFEVDTRTGDNVALFVVGVVMLLTLPFVARGLTLMHRGIARLLLGRLESDALREQVAEVSASRQAAVAAEGTALRRLERDIHDGPQQRLVRLQMDLAAAERQLDQDPDRARTLLSEAIGQSKDALDELRALSRGFAPPILVDRGLAAALQSLADRSPVPVRVTNELPADAVLPDEVERAAYFVAAEALTNVAKHAAAREARLSVRIARVPDGPASLELAVSDDGTGGAASVPGHGLAGLEERLRGVGGTLSVSSPVGGPTVVSARLPIPAPVATGTGATAAG